ncbi:MAG: HlyD family efflux transporter periplasmic adaptor subunit [Muricomes sp.]
MKKKGQDETLDTFDTEIISDDVSLEEDSYELEDAEASKPPKKKLPAWVIIPIIVVLGIIIAVASLLSKNGSGSKSTVLQVSEVTTGDVREVYNASGKIESENTKTYYSPVTAPIASCNAVVGNTVKAGDLLIAFDTKNLERDNQQAQLTLQSSLYSSQATRAQNAKSIDAANAASAQAADQANKLADKVNNLAAQVDAAKQELAAAQPAIEDLQNKISGKTQTVNAYQTIIDNVNSNYQGSRAAFDIASQKPDDQKTEDDLATINALSPIFDEYDDAVKKLPEAQKDLSAAQAELDALTSKNANVANLQAQYDAAYAQWEAAYNAANTPSSNTGMTSAEMSNLEISDNLAELSALTSAELVEKGREGMKSDMNGVIASVDALQTNTATQGMAMFTIASTEKVRVKIEVSPDDYEKIKVGNKAAVTIGQYKYQGTLTKVNKIALNNEKGNPVIGAEIHIDNPDENVCIGATAKISMTVAEAHDVLVVPTEVINTSSDGDFVYIIKDGVVKKQPVELGTASTTQIEVTSGLKKGDKVVNDLNVDITEGMKATGSEKPAADDSKAKDKTDDSAKGESGVSIQTNP